MEDGDVEGSDEEVMERDLEEASGGKEPDYECDDKEEKPEELPTQEEKFVHSGVQKPKMWGKVIQKAQMRKMRDRSWRRSQKRNSLTMRGKSLKRRVPKTLKLTRSLIFPLKQMVSS